MYSRLRNCARLHISQFPDMAIHVLECLPIHQVIPPLARTISPVTAVFTAEHK
jgi:hypothetical protein